jgi:hypothetical protein
VKSFGLFALLLIVSLNARAELDTLWSRDIAIGLSSYAIEGAVILQNGQVMAASGHSDAGAVDLWRYDRTGSLVWNGTVTVDGQYCSILGMDQYADGQIALVGVTWSETDSMSSFTVIRINESGTLLGQDRYSMPLTNFSNKVGVCATRDNNLLVFAALFNSESGFYSDILLKVDSRGDTLWTRHISSQADSWGTSVAELPNGDLVLAGTTVSDNFAYDGFVARALSNGDVQWENVYTSEVMAQLSPNAVAVDHLGNIYAGGSEGFWFGFMQPWAVCIQPNGDPIWSLSGMDGSFFSITGIRPTIDGGAIISGSSAGEFAPMVGRIYTLSPNGVAGGSELEVEGEDLRGMYVRENGSLIYGTYAGATEYVGRLYYSGPGYGATGFVRAQGTNEPLPNVKVEMIETGDFTMTDAQGIYTLGVGQATGTLRASGPCITTSSQTVELVEGDETVVNFTVGIPAYENNTSSVNIIGTFGRWERDTLTVYNDGNGALSFSTEAIEHTPTYGWLFVAPAHGEIAAGSSAQIVVSTLTNPNHPESEFFGEIEIHHNACPDTLDEVGVYILALDTPENPTLVESFAVHPAYPNPFNNSARVSFDLPRAAHVTATLYSIEGRHVATLVDDALPAGSHGLLVDGANFATGVYLLRVSAGEFVDTQKLVLLK